uniref:Uncharacterized protein n=1 Tax=Triticum urartu TaxID=4572 RepID=A0A8R7PJT7_TRIUA
VRVQSSLWKIGTRASHPLPRTLARLFTSAAAAAAKKKKDDLRRQLPPVPLLPQPEGRRVLRQEENGRAEAEGPEVQGQREQACNERMSVARTVRACKA